MVYDKIPILDTALRCGVSIHDNGYSSTEMKGDCPFCGKVKHFYINTFNDQFHCQWCKENGNSVTLYAKLNNVDNLTAYLELTEGAERFPIAHRKNTTSVDNQQVKLVPMKPLSDRHDVYYDMLQILNLSDLHKNNLLRRGLDEKTISLNMYRTIPTKNSELYHQVISDLQSHHDLSGIPGFFPDEYGNIQMYIPKGLLIPYCNQFGYIQGIQIRRDNVEKDKCRWFSSSFVQGGSKLTLPSFIHIANWKGSKTAYLTEGGLKADVASFLMDNACVLGLSGVENIKGLVNVLKELGITHLIEAFDMDKFENPKVIKALDLLNQEIAKTGIKYNHATWNPRYNGLDDFHLALCSMQSNVA